MNEVIYLKSKGDNKKSKSNNSQEKIFNIVDTIEGKNTNINQAHNTKKESLGPNTKR